MSKLDGRITLKLSDSFAALPHEVRKAAEDAGSTKGNTYAVLHKDGSVYLIRDAHATREQLEKSIFHEAFMKLMGNSEGAKKDDRASNGRQS